MSDKGVIVRVVGVTFCDGYPDNLTRLAEMAADRVTEGQRMEPIPAVLVRNPGNAYDTNAIEVHVPALGQQIGHLPRETAAAIAPVIDAGQRWRADVVEVVIHPDHPERPGIAVECQRVVES